MKSFLFLSVLISFNALAAFNYPIRSCSDLVLLQQHPNDNFSLINDIDCSQKDLNFEFIYYFNGTLNGNGKEIKLDMTIGSKDYVPSALFDQLGTNTIIKDLNFNMSYRYTQNAKSMFNDRAGLARVNDGLLSNIRSFIYFYNEPKVKNNITSGLISRNNANGIIKDCNVTVLGMDYSYAFYGLVAHNEGLVENSHVNDLNFNDQNQMITSFAGFVGENKGTIKDSSVVNASVDINTGDRDFNFGGFCSDNFGIIINAESGINLKLNLENTFSNIVYLGGFASFDAGIVENSSSYIKINLKKDLSDTLKDFRAFFGNTDQVSKTNKFIWHVDGDL